MTAPTTSDLLKYVDLQMAAEAFLRDPETSATHFFGSDLATALVKGNLHASKFTQPQADNFAAHWIVVDQKANTSTGFSGTLFRCTADDPATGAKVGELVMSCRSTEFLEDGARDNKATNALELKQFGWAFGQVSDLESWYKSLQAGGKIGPSDQFTITGYSLGASLATAFSLMHKNDVNSGGQPIIRGTYTFNGAGVGDVNSSTTLANVIANFQNMRIYGSADAFTRKTALQAYQYLQPLFATSTTTTVEQFQVDAAITYVNNLKSASDVTDAIGQAQMKLLSDALQRIKAIALENTRVAGLQARRQRHPPPECQ